MTCQEYCVIRLDEWTTEDDEHVVNNLQASKPSYVVWTLKENLKLSKLYEDKQLKQKQAAS